MIGFEELLSPVGPSWSIKDSYDPSWHIVEHSYSKPISFDNDHTSPRLLCYCMIGFE